MKSSICRECKTIPCCKQEVDKQKNFVDMGFLVPGKKFRDGSFLQECLSVTNMIFKGTALIKNISSITT